MTVAAPYSVDAKQWPGSIMEDSPLTLYARITGAAIAAVQQADIASGSYSVYDLSSTTPETAINTVSLTISSVIFDTLQTGGRWVTDATGYNFAVTIAKTLHNTEDRRYRAEFTLTPTSGDAFTFSIDYAVRKFITT